VNKNPTYPSREADVIDESGDIGGAQVQHGQQGLYRKTDSFQSTNLLFLCDNQ